MDLEEKYQQVFGKMDDCIKERIDKQVLTALGYTSNLDLLCNFDVEILNQLLMEYTPKEQLHEMQAPALITSVQDFIHAVVYYCLRGMGGEIDIEDFSLIENIFAVREGMGGTAVQAGMALSALGCPSLVHLTDDSKEVCRMLQSPYIYTVSDKGELIHTEEVVAKAEQEIHYIIQFKRGDVIHLGENSAIIPMSNRLIVTKITVNETVPFSKDYFAYIENHASYITSNVLSSFNGIQEKDVLRERLAFVQKHCKKYKEKNPQGIVYFEDAHYHNETIRKMCLETIYSHVDIVSLNEEELAYTLKAYDMPVELDNILSGVKGVEYLLQKFGIQRGIIVHTKDYSMYVGKKLESDIETGLMYGNLLAAAKAMTGWYGKKEALEEVMKLPLSEKGCKGREIILQENLQNVVLVPSKYMDKPKYTIGLGDSFVAGVQLCFA